MSFIFKYDNVLKKQDIAKNESLPTSVKRANNMNPLKHRKCFTPNTTYSIAH